MLFHMFCAIFFCIKSHVLEIPLFSYTKHLFLSLYLQDVGKKQKIDLQKLFTPSTDFEEIKPGKNRK